MLSSSHATTSSLLPLTVQETGFLVDRLGQDCHKLQFLRELTQKRHRGVAAVDATCRQTHHAQGSNDCAVVNQAGDEELLARILLPLNAVTSQTAKECVSRDIRERN